MSYDPEEDILTLSRGRKVKASIEIGDFVIDIDHKGYVTGLEVLDASTTLGIPEPQLDIIKNTTMTVKYKHNYVLIMLFFQLADKDKEITIPLTVDLGHRNVILDKACFAAG